MLDLKPKTEAELRQAVIDRLIAASVNDSKCAREAALARWRALGGALAGSGNSPGRTIETGWTS